MALGLLGSVLLASFVRSTVGVAAYAELISAASVYQGMLKSINDLQGDGFYF